MINAIDLFPLRKSLLNYSKDNLKGDLKAGINVTLLTFPTAMAYALIAGLPIEYGLYGAMVGTIMGACML
jgi:SulP family sulfate permease